MQGDDFREGLTAILAIKMKNVQFEGQTKGKLGTPIAKQTVEQIIIDQFAYYLMENKSLAEQIVKNAIRNQKAREAARKAREEVREGKKAKKQEVNLSGKLSPCQGHNKAINELFLVEGDSAGGSAKGGRDRKYQAILPLRGKVLNTEKASAEAALKNEEIATMMEDVGEMQEILDSSGYYTIDTKISEYANGLGLNEIGLDRDVSELSGGQRAKVLLAKVLLENPMILILDETTNFLDENHIAWLTNFLQNYENAFILVSHDVPFMNSVINVVYHVENAVMTRYTGDYDNFVRMYELKKRQIEQAYEKQQKEIADLLKITVESVNKKINGKEPFTFEQVKTLCNHYQISADVYFI